ncbi:MAG: response regulator transcription factor [Pseudomonadota bacterium]
MSARLNVLLVEDDIDLSATLVDYLMLKQIDCDHAPTGRAGLALAQAHDYDVLILDVSLPGMNGLEVCQALRGAGNTTPILMLTARDRLEDKLSGFDAGTDDYLTKPFASEELLARLRALSGRQSSQAKLLNIGVLQIDLGRKQARICNRDLELTPTGWILLEALGKASPNTLSRAQLAHAVWGEDMPDSNSLNVHLHHLRHAVNSQAKQTLIRTIKGVGVSLRAEYEI